MPRRTAQSIARESSEVKEKGTVGTESTLILEVKGEEDNRDRAKYTYARSWVASVNRDGRHGRWDFAVVRHPTDVKPLMDRLSRGDGA